MVSRTTLRGLMGADQVNSISFSRDYEHHRRRVVPGPDFVLPSIRLKWYQIHRPDVEIPLSLSAGSRHFVQGEIEAGKLKITDELGFAMLHLGDESGSRNTFAMLFVCTWRSNNELWRTLYTKSLRSEVGYEIYADDGHVGGFCVWELAAVWHERQAWSRFLYSGRDERALDAYLNDKLDDLV